MATHRGRARGLSVLAAAAFLAQSLVVAAPVALPGTASTAAAASLPSGFVDETLVTGLSNPTVIAYAPDGRVFVAEKRGIVKSWATVADFNSDGPRVQTLDIRTDVMNYWDRGLLGLAVDPNWPSSPYIYLMYAYDAIPGGSAPRWGVAGADGDACPTPPGGTSDGCVSQSRLERDTVNPATGVVTSRQTLLTGWCQQFPSHSAGTVAFGPDGMLYVSGGDGASFNGGAQDYGQKGGNLPNTSSPITPKNPCGDPPGGLGGSMSAPTAEGGALRSQSFRRPAGEAAVLNGTVLRLNPATGGAASGNPAIGNSDPIRQRMVAYGLRNPFRMTFRPGTTDLYVGDVGYSTWEEVNRLANPIGAGGPVNFGWPCHEGPETGTYYTTTTLNLCATLDDPSVTAPLYDYAQSGHMASGDGCPPVPPATSAGASVSGLAFAETNSYPDPYKNALFAADYSRNCIVVLPVDGSGVPTGTAIPFESNAATPVDLTTDPNGNIVYGDFGGGNIHRIRYSAPIASFTVTPSSGMAPLSVSFDGSGSSAPASITAYDWDFGDGSTDSGQTTSHTYAAGTWTARLTVTDSNGMTATTSRSIAAGNQPPVATIDSPTCTTNCWAVGDPITLTAHATDPNDGTLPASAFSWHVGLQHCHTPSDCHEHDLLDATGVKSTSIVAPDHEAGSYLRISVTVKDSGGLTDTETIDVHPRQSTMTVVSSPAGLPVALDGVAGTGSVGPTAVIVGHAATVEAQATAAIGETMYAFSSWSDGKALIHTATAPASPQTLTATYHVTGGDAPATCAAAPVQAATGNPMAGKFGSTDDVDWIRFNVAAKGWYRIVLGDLPVDGILELFSGCSGLITTIDQPGLHWEEILANLTPGTYAIRMASTTGASSDTSYHWSVKALTGTTPLLMVASAPSAGLRYVGDVFNTATTPRSVTITAKLYSSSGKLLGSTSVHPLVTVMAGRSRSPFVINAARPAGFAYVKFTITSTPASTSTRLLTVSGTASGPTPSTWKVDGTIKNTSSTTASNVTYLLEIYNAFGTVINATTGHPLATTLAKGASTTFSVTFSGLNGAPMGTTARARAT